MYKSKLNFKKKEFVSLDERTSNSSRASTILPFMEGSTFFVYNGLKYRSISIKPDMFGNKFGDYVPTKQICVYKRRKNKKRKSNRK